MSVPEKKSADTGAAKRRRKASRPAGGETAALGAVPQTGRTPAPRKKRTTQPVTPAPAPLETTTPRAPSIAAHPVTPEPPVAAEAAALPMRSSPANGSARTSVEPSPRRPYAKLSAEDRRRLIAETAYLKAMRRGFRGQRAEQDWYEAEAEVDAMLLERSTPSPGA